MPTVKDLVAESEHNSKKIITLYNPLTKDFTVKYGKRNYTIRGLETYKFPFVIANHVKKHLVNAVLNERGVKTNPEEEMAGIRKEVEVEI